MELQSVRELEKAYATIFEDLAGVYTISFVPPKRETRDHLRRVTVTTTREGVMTYPYPKFYSLRP
jgi:hypothetical protein